MDKRELTKADLDKVRHIEGFPKGRDADIIALSDPPYYTAFPNPFIKEWLEEHGTPYDESTDDYHREPFTADVSEGKNDPIYNAHSYHTKVPHKAIMRYILHYTKPGDVVFDGFCGTGMTGVAAQMCESPDAGFKMTIEKEMPNIEWGARKAILSDLSPAATFIAYNYNTPVDVAKFKEEVERILAEVEEEYGWMYETQHTVGDAIQLGFDGRPMGRINYTVWSDVLICPTCSNELVFWDVAVDKENGKVIDPFTCSHCGSELKKRQCERAQTSSYDVALKKSVTMAKQVPVLINYSIGKKRFEKVPDDEDLALLEKIDGMEIPYWYPTERMCEGKESRRNDKAGIMYVHQFYTKRNLAVLSALWSKAIRTGSDLGGHNIKRVLLFLITGAMIGLSRLQRFRLFSTFPNMILSGTLYIGSMVREWNVLNWVKGKYNSVTRLKNAINSYSETAIVTETTSAHSTSVPESSADYLFTDPPFGSNLNYSELSFIWEAWLKVFTNQESEAIINTVQGKGLAEYQSLMTRCFQEYYRVLKPGRWMTVVFHNSKNAVWNAIQESLQRSGFIVADVRTLDKKQGSFKQVTTTAAVKQDLVISAYKPKAQFRREFLRKAGTEETAWSFVNQYLENLPVLVVKNNRIEVISERQAYLLFDRMVAYHIMNGLVVPLDAADFYRGLEERYLKRDEMYFLADQVNEYDTARIQYKADPIQLEFVVSNEKSAIAWLTSQLKDKQTYAELQPKFMQELRSTDRYEQIPELAVLLEENFLQDEGGKWYLPDVRKEADVLKLREKKLVREFEGYLATKGKLKLFRTEAIRAGFAKLWEEGNYKLIVETAERLPEALIQEDDKLLMYYDISLGRV